MFSLYDRAGNVVTTVALFVVAVSVLSLLGGAFLVLCCLFSLPTCSNPRSRSSNTIHFGVERIALWRSRRAT